ncbi:MAG TPA: hypothetical protein VN679_12930, partial [Candidatus Acidoferrales bacterium]|nr:hypothetical protein [Candidatus Acidoferrales bacterium]
MQAQGQDGKGMHPRNISQKKIREEDLENMFPEIYARDFHNHSRVSRRKGDKATHRQQTFVTVCT